MSIYLFYGLISKEEVFPEWLEKEDSQAILYDIVDKNWERIKEEYDCILDTAGDIDKPQLILGIGQKVYGIPSEDQKPVAFFVTDGNTPVKIETCRFMGWDDQLNEAADYLGWPKEERDIGWWLIESF